MDSLILLLNSKIPQLPESERKIAQYIISKRGEVLDQNISDVARATGSSSSAVTRLCKSLDISGFAQMKLMLARDVFAESEETDEDDNSIKIDPILNNTIISSIETLKDLRNTISPETIKKAIGMILKAKYINVFGAGLSNSIAYDFSHKLLRLGFACGSAQSSQIQALLANNMKPDMLGIIVSHSGNTQEMVSIAKLLKRHGVPLIGLTCNSEGKIAALCDIVLLSTPSEPLYRQGASSSRIAQLAVIDMVFSTIVSQDTEHYMAVLKETYEAYEPLSISRAKSNGDISEKYLF